MLKTACKAFVKFIPDHIHDAFRVAKVLNLLNIVPFPISVSSLVRFKVMKFPPLYLCKRNPKPFLITYPYFRLYTSTCILN